MTDNLTDRAALTAQAKIKHCVYLEFKPIYNHFDRLAIIQKLADLQPIIVGFLSIEFGDYLDFENKTSCNAGFIIDFASETALLNYADHPAHKKIGTQLVKMAEGGADAIMVYDILVA